MSGSRWVMQGKQTQRTGSNLWDLLEQISALMLANLCCILFAIPLITIPAATAGLFAIVSPWARGKPGDLFQDFLQGMREHWRKSTIIFVIDLAVGGLIALNVSILPRMHLPLPVFALTIGVMIFVGTLALLTNVYLWPMLVVFDFPLRKLISSSIQVAFLKPWQSLFIAIMGGAPRLIGAVLPAAITLLVTVSLCALLISRGAWRVIRLYVAAEELSKLESSTLIPAKLRR
jgi:uncharacterized membrane protein YesL